MQEGKLLGFVKGLATLLETNPNEEIIFPKVTNFWNAVG
jgi:hypothetical protein